MRSPHTTARESPHTATKPQHSQKKKKKITFRAWAAGELGNRSVWLLASTCSTLKGDWMHRIWPRGGWGWGWGACQWKGESSLVSLENPIVVWGEVGEGLEEELVGESPEFQPVCKVASVVSDSVQSYALAHRAPLSMGFSRKEYRSGLLFPSPGDLPDPGIKPTSLISPALAGRFFITSATWQGQHE